MTNYILTLLKGDENMKLKRHLKLPLFTLLATPLAFFIHTIPHFIFYRLADNKTRLITKYFEPIPNHWAAEAVQKTVELGVIGGTTESTTTAAEIAEKLPDLSSGAMAPSYSVLVLIGLALGPIVTHLIGYLSLYLYKKYSHTVLWAISFAAQFRTFMILRNKDAFDTFHSMVDEVILARQLGLPDSSLYWISIILGLICYYLLLKSLKVDKKFATIGLSSLCSIIGLKLLYAIQVFQTRIRF